MRASIERMAIEEAEMLHLERLARLDQDADERAALGKDLEAILDFFALLQEVDTDGIEPMVRPVLPERTMRADVLAPSLPRERVLALSNASEDGFVRVPRTVDET